MNFDRVRRSFLAVLIFLNLAATSVLAAPQVAVSVRPLALVVREICKDVCVVVEMIPPGASEHHWEPSPKDVVRSAGSILGVGIGTSFVKKLMKTMLPNLPGKQKTPQIFLSNSISLMKIGVNELSGGHHGHGHGHDHGELDPHVWFDPYRMKQVVPMITEALVGVLPTQEKTLRANAVATELMLSELDKEISKVSSGWRKAKVLVLHDATGYFSDRYKVDIKAFSSGGTGHEFSPRDLAKLNKKLNGPVAGVVVEKIDGLGRNLAKELKSPIVEVDFSGSKASDYRQWMMNFVKILDGLFSSAKK